MNDQDRIDRLERRVASLEQLMRRMMSGDVETSDAPPPAAPPPTPEPVRPLVAPVPPPERPKAEPVLARKPLTAAPERPVIDGEQWVGQRGLLAVGVVALVLAAGYLLKLSFDRGWVSPMLRCITGGITGVVVSVLGLSIYNRGYRTYGPALIGTGAAIIYSVLWAASRWYGFIPPMTAVAGMAGISILLAACAWMIDVEWLCATAGIGAFTAPLIIGSVNADADRLLLYLVAIGLTMGAVAWTKGWRLAMLVVALSYFGVGVVAADAASELLAIGFGAVGGAAGMSIGLRKNWWETRFLSFTGAWSCLAFASNDRVAPYVLVGALCLAWPVWAHSLLTDDTWPFRGTESARSLLSSVSFYLTPFGLVWAVGELDVAFIGQHDGMATAIVALVYLVVGVTGARRPFALVGTLGAILAVWWEWEGRLPAGAVLGAMAVAWGSVARVTKRTDWDLHAFIALLAAIGMHWLIALPQRHELDPAFMDRWALVLWGLLICTIALAMELRSRAEHHFLPDLPPALWILAGIECLGGVSWELDRFFTLRAAMGTGSVLAGSLAVSAWWLVCSGGLVWYGFRSGMKPVRLAGLLVSGMAITKVLLFDLSKLDALYRVGSVFLLGLVSLLVAWAYHRKAREEAAIEADRLQG